MQYRPEQNQYGFWGPVDVTMDWCEGNYEVVSYIAEYWNTISSLPIIALGLFGAFNTRRHATLDLRFTLGFLMLALVGCGSAAFHATLRRQAQMLDELPMMFGNMFLVYALVENEAKVKYGWKLPAVLAGICVGVTYIYLHAAGFGLFMFIYTSVTTGVMVRALYCAYKLSRQASTPSNRVGLSLFIWSELTYVGGFALWLLDMFLCEHVQHLHFHSFWHLGAGCGTYLLIQFQVALRCQKLKNNVRLLRYHGATLPQVVSEA